MPYTIVRRAGVYCVYRRSSEGRPFGKRLGTHRRLQDARRQLRALYAAEAGAPSKRTAGARGDYPPSEAARAARIGMAHAHQLGIPIPRLALGLACCWRITPSGLRAMLRFFDSLPADHDLETTAQDSPERALYWCFGARAGEHWARTLLSSAKTLSTTGGVWAAVDTGYPARFRAGEPVWVVSLHRRGVVDAVRRLVRSGGIVYTVRFDDGGLCLCKARDLKPAAALSIKQPDERLPDDERQAIILEAARQAAGQGNAPDAPSAVEAPLSEESLS